MNQPQSQTPSTTTGMGTATAETGDLGLVITELDISGQRHYLAGASQASAATSQTDVAGQTQGQDLTVIDVDHGAPAVAVISSPSASVTTPGAAVGVGAGTATQVVIKGERIQVPSQTVVEFRLQEPLNISDSPNSNISPTPNLDQNKATPNPDMNK